MAFQYRNIAYEAMAKAIVNQLRGASLNAKRQVGKVQQVLHQLASGPIGPPNVLVMDQVLDELLESLNVLKQIVDGDWANWLESLDRYVRLGMLYLF